MLLKFLIGFFIWLQLTSIGLAQEVAAAPAEPGLFPLIFYYIDMIAQGMFGLMILATAIARIYPGKKDDMMVESASAKVMKGLSYLPTFGINPRTKKLEEELKALREQKKS